MKKLSLAILSLFLFTVVGFAQEAKPAPNVDPSRTVWAGGPFTTFPVIKRNGAPLEARIAEPAQIPTRLFAVRNGNGLTESGTTYTRATYIAFKDNTSKDALIDAVCAMGGYQATVPNPAYDPNVEGSQPTIPNPQTKQQFFNKRIEQFLRDNYRAWKTSVAEKAAKATAEAAADAELPPNQ